jgi:hypothetical protein
MPEAFCVHNTPPRANLPVSVRTRLTQVVLVQWQGPCPRPPNWSGSFDPARHFSKELKVAHDGHVLDAAGEIQEHLAGVEDYILAEAVWPRTSVSAKASDQGVEKLSPSPSAGGTEISA